MFSFIAKVLVALNSNSRPGELSSGIAFGFTLALIPGGNLLWVLIFSIAFLLKHNLGAMLLSLLLFSAVTGFMDPLLHKTGLVILSQAGLEPLFIKMADMPLLPWIKFNNTMVMGSFIWSMILWLPIFFLFQILVKLYRQKVAGKIADSKFVKSIGKIPFVSKINSAYKRLGFLI